MDVFDIDQDILSVSVYQHLLKRLSRLVVPRLLSFCRCLIICSKPKAVVEAISSLLSNTRPDDAISGELADLVGFEDIELVAELLTSRSYFVDAVSVAINLIALDHSRNLVVWIGTNDGGTSNRYGGENASYRQSVLSNITYSSLTWASAAIDSIAPQDVRRRMEETLRANASRPLFTGIAVSLISQLREISLKISSKRHQKCFHTCTLHPLWCKAACFHILVQNSYFHSGLLEITTRLATVALLDFICSLVK